MSQKPSFMLQYRTTLLWDLWARSHLRCVSHWDCCVICNLLYCHGAKQRFVCVEISPTQSRVSWERGLRLQLLCLPHGTWGAVASKHTESPGCVAAVGSFAADQPQTRFRCFAPRRDARPAEGRGGGSCSRPAARGPWEGDAAAPAVLAEGLWAPWATARARRWRYRCGQVNPSWLCREPSPAPRLAAALGLPTGVSGRAEPLPSPACRLLSLTCRFFLLPVQESRHPAFLLPSKLLRLVIVGFFLPRQVDNAGEKPQRVFLAISGRVFHLVSGYERSLWPVAQTLAQGCHSLAVFAAAAERLAERQALSWCWAHTGASCLVPDAKAFDALPGSHVKGLPWPPSSSSARPVDATQRETVIAAAGVPKPRPAEDPEWETAEGPGDASHRASPGRLQPCWALWRSPGPGVVSPWRWRLLRRRGWRRLPVVALTLLLRFHWKRLRGARSRTGAQRFPGCFPHGRRGVKKCPGVWWSSQLKVSISTEDARLVPV